MQALSSHLPNNKQILRIVVITLALLTIPLIGMLFSQEVNWSAADFLVMGVMLFATGFFVEYTRQRYSNTPFRLISAGIVGIFLTLWALLAVGI